MISPADLADLDRRITQGYANLESQVMTRQGVYELIGIASRLHDEVVALRCHKDELGDDAVLGAMLKRLVHRTIDKLGAKR